MEEVAAVAVGGIIERTPPGDVPYLIIIAVIIGGFIALLFLMNKYTDSVHCKSIEQVRISYDNIMKSQQQTIENLTNKIK